MRVRNYTNSGGRRLNKTETSIRTLPGDPEMLGAKLLPNGVNFAVVVPDDLEAFLVLHLKDQTVNIPLPAEERTGEISAVLIRDISPRDFGYYYLIDGEKQLDPFAAEIRGGICYCEQNTFDWQGDHPINRSISEMTIYKLHVRGFTKKKGSGVTHRGTFRGVIEKIPYIQELGFNTVALLPIYEWDDALDVLPPYAKAEPSGAPVSEVTTPRNYWGYSARNFYYAPKQSFSSQEDSVSEVKEMVRALHSAGIEVIMELYFPEKTWPSDAQETVRFWKKQYHIDGFRFVGAGTPVESLVRDPLLKRTKMFFENIDIGWIYGGSIPKYRHLIESNERFQERARCFLKGDEDQVFGFTEILRRNPAEIGHVNYLAGVNGFTLNDCVSYDWKHNEANGENNQDGPAYNYSWNCGTEGKTRKKAVLALRQKQLRNALTYLYLAQGIPMLMAGDECGNTQAGNNNAYSSDNPIGWVDWSHSKTDTALHDFVVQLAEFRRQHPILHTENALRGIDYLNLGYPDISFHDSRAWVSAFDRASRTVGIMYCGLYAEDASGKPDDFIYAAYNAYWEEHEFGLPTLPAGYAWQVAIDTSAEAGEEFKELLSVSPLDDQKLITAKARSVLVLIGRKGVAKKRIKNVRPAKPDVEASEKKETTEVKETAKE